MATNNESTSVQIVVEDVHRSDDTTSKTIGDPSQKDKSEPSSKVVFKGSSHFSPNSTFQFYMNKKANDKKVALQKKFRVI